MLSNIYKLKDTNSGKCILPVSVIDAILSNDGSKTLTEIISLLESRITNISVSYILQTVEEGFHFVDANGNIVISIDNNGFNSVSINSDLINIISNSIGQSITDQLGGTILDDLTTDFTTDTLYRSNGTIYSINSSNNQPLTSKIDISSYIGRILHISGYWENSYGYTLFVDSNMSIIETLAANNTIGGSTIDKIIPKNAKYLLYSSYTFDDSNNAILCSIKIDKYLKEIVESEKSKLHNLQEQLNEIANINYSDGENIDELALAEATDNLFIEVFDQTSLTNKKVNLKTFIQSLI